jgi:hypothetical protein
MCIDLAESKAALNGRVDFSGLQGWTFTGENNAAQG